MKLDNPLWFKVTLTIMILIYIVTLIPFIVATKSLTFYYGITGMLLFSFYYLIILALIFLLKGNIKGAYIFFVSQIGIVAMYLLIDIDFSLEYAVLRPLVFSVLILIGIKANIIKKIKSE